MLLRRRTTPSSSGLALVFRRFSTVESLFRLNHLNRENRPLLPPPPLRVREIVSPSTALRATTSSMRPDVLPLRLPFGTSLRDALVSLLHAVCCTILTHSLTYSEAPRPASAPTLHSSLFRFTRNVVLSSFQFLLYTNAKKFRRSNWRVSQRQSCPPNRHFVAEPSSSRSSSHPIFVLSYLTDSS